MILRLPLVLFLLSSVNLAIADCAPLGMSRDQLLEWRDQVFSVAEAQQRQSLARGLLECLAHSDPQVRDGVAFEALSKWLRAGDIDGPTIRGMTNALLEVLAGADSPERVHHAFAVLVLSELARADRIKPTLKPSERQQLIAAAAAFMRGITDYRGFDDQVGWRHQVAHGADLVLQLAINPAVTEEQSQELLNALAQQIAPQGVAYIQGESERLARAVYFAHQRGPLDAQWWQQWFADISAAPEGEDWAQSFKSSTGLARRHDILAFLYALHYAAGSGEGAQAQALEALVNAAVLRVQS